MRHFTNYHENLINEQYQTYKYTTTYTFTDPFERLIPKMYSWTHPEGQQLSLDVFVSKCRIDINNILSKNITSVLSNTSNVDRNAIKTLQEIKYIVMKPVDKGGPIVVCRRKLYVQECLHQFSFTDFYYPILNEPTSHQQDVITATKTEQISHKCLPSSAMNFNQDNSICANFYLLQKIHEEDNHGRAIVSTINCPTELISQYIDAIILPVVTKLQTFIRDTSDVNRLLRDIKFTVDYPNRYLFTMDICSPCTNIPTASALFALKYYLEYYSDENRPTTPALLRLTELVLN